MIIPTIEMMMKVYEDAASVERLICGQPSINTVRNTTNASRNIIAWLHAENRGSTCSGPNRTSAALIDETTLHRYLQDLLQTNVRPITAISYINHFQQLFARWIRPYYSRLNWKIPEFPSVDRRIKPSRYTRPGHSRLSAVKKWYQSLSSLASQNQSCQTQFAGRRRSVGAYELWFAATMMLEFAIRNSDIARLTPDNFVENNGHIYLIYVPHKTANTSGRKVKWPVHTDIWRTLSAAGRLRLPEIDADTFAALNRQMRSLGFCGSKGAYELRKLCIDHIYQKFGAEMAVSISGDNIKTIMYYYADPSQPNVGDIRVSELL